MAAAGFDQAGEAQVAGKLYGLLNRLRDERSGCRHADFRRQLVGVFLVDDLLCDARIRGADDVIGFQPPFVPRYGRQRGVVSRDQDSLPAWVCLLGETLVHELFGDESPVGVESAAARIFSST